MNRMSFLENFRSERIYKSYEINEMIEKGIDKVKIYKKRSKNNSIEYYNCPAAFDIETSSFLNEDGNKAACMYEFTFGLNGLVLIGRTWEEWEEIQKMLSLKLGLSENRHLIIGVHNLSYEFQFLCKRCTWEKVFAVDERKPVYAITSLGIEYRDTYILSGYSLETVGKNLNKYKVKKLVGNLDYKKIRHSKTELTENEIAYCVNDVQVVQAYLQECIESEGNITRIPLTKTGYVRRFVRRSCFGMDIKEKNFKKWNYQGLMKCLTLEPAEYKMLKRAFQGGFTHANPFYSGETLHNVQSMDLTSSYPTQLCLPVFPMSKGELHPIESAADFEKQIKCYCCLFDIELEGLESKFLNDSYISESRCMEKENAIINNGRIVSADRIVTTITEQDYKIIRKVYTWKSAKIGTFYRYQRGYLPEDFIKAVLALYKSKTELKGLQGNDANGVPYAVTYLSRKSMLNACFGMAVTDIVRDEISYDDKWITEAPVLNEAIQKYNEDKNRFLFYPWGVWCTSCARSAVWTAIFNLNDDYIYCDTDSVKYLHPEKHADYFKRYNEWITKRLKMMCLQFGFSEDYIAPRTSKGIKKPLGVWDFDGIYKTFKTLGAKRYMLQYAENSLNGSNAGQYSLTVSGINKRIAMPYILHTYKNPFKAFNKDLYIPAGKTGKNTHTYIDGEIKGMITDYRGSTAAYDELSCIHLSEADYYFSLAEEYIAYLTGLKQEVIQ